MGHTLGQFVASQHHKKTRTRGNNRPSGFTGHCPWVNLEAQGIPQPQERQPDPTCSASVLGSATQRLWHVPGSPLASDSFLPLPPLPEVWSPMLSQAQREAPATATQLDVPPKAAASLAGVQDGLCLLVCMHRPEVRDVCAYTHRLRFCSLMGTWTRCAHRSGSLGLGDLLHFPGQEV